MHWIDWLIVAIPSFLVMYIGFKTQRYVQGVSDFLAAGRVAGRYIICVAAGEAGLGLISVVASFEYYYKSGTALAFWQNIAAPIGLIMTLTGFLVYRYRQTRVLTMAQFFEIRYSRGFRIFAGFLSFLAGVVNYALFPAVGARFFIYYCGLPDTVSLLGLSLSTYGLLMALFLGVALVVVLVGGQLMTMVTDCVQGIFSYFCYAVIVFSLLNYFSMDQIKAAMLARPEGESFINPFNIGNLTEFNILYVLIGIFGSILGRMSWQGSQGYNCAAKNPHEQKMGGVLGVWRGGFSTLVIMLLVVGAYTYLNHPDFYTGAQAVKTELAERINFDNPTVTETIRTQMQVPVALRHILPIGVTGAFAALMLFLMVSTDTTYLHSWGSILVQDVILPLRGKPFSPKTQMRLLRLSIFGVAAFAWIFSYYFGQVTYILMFFAITGAVYTGGAGIVIVGGMYSRWGKASGAWAAMAVGGFLGVSGFLCQKFWGSDIYPFWQAHSPETLASFKMWLEGLGAALPIVNWKVGPLKFPFSGQEMLFMTQLGAISMYLLFSWLGKRETFDLDRMLHRGKYDTAREHMAVDTGKAAVKSSWIRKLIGINDEYSRGDRILAWSVFIWSGKTILIFLLLLVWNVFIYRWSEDGWFLWWKYYTLGVSLLVGLVTMVWFTIGGTRDLIHLFRDLKRLQRSDLDDGRVVGHLSAVDAVQQVMVEPEGKAFTGTTGAAGAAEAKDTNAR